MLPEKLLNSIVYKYKVYIHNLMYVCGYTRTMCDRAAPRRAAAGKVVFIVLCPHVDPILCILTKAKLGSTRPHQKVNQYNMYRVNCARVDFKMCVFGKIIIAI